MNPLPIGYKLDDTYEILGILGRGGFGITYLARDRNLEKEVAIKEYAPVDNGIRSSNLEVLPASPSQRKDFDWGLESFLRGARTLARFDHSSIVRVDRFFKSNLTKTAYLVMEMIRGKDLIGFSETVTSPTEIQNAFESLALALSLVHDADFQHRDVKPENIIIRDSTSEPVLIDFDSARQLNAERTVPLVTPYYSAVEQYSSDNIQGPFSDIYSLCASFVRIITGEPPGDAPSRILNDTYKNLADDSSLNIFDNSFLKKIDRGMALLPGERPQTINELLKPQQENSLTDSKPTAATLEEPQPQKASWDEEFKIPRESKNEESYEEFKIPQQSKNEESFARVVDKYVKPIYKFIQDISTEAKAITGLTAICLVVFFLLIQSPQTETPPKTSVSSTSSARNPAPAPASVPAPQNKKQEVTNTSWTIAVDGRGWTKADLLSNLALVPSGKKYSVVVKAKSPFRVRSGGKLGLSSSNNRSYGAISTELYLKNLDDDLQIIEIEIQLQ